MKPNVLHLIGSFHQGGSERQAVQLVRLLHESGRCNLNVACLNREGVLMNEIERLGFVDVPEFRLDSFYNRTFFKQLRAFAKLLRENEIKIVQTHDFYTNVFGMFAATIARTPVRIAAKRETAGFRTSSQNFVEHRAFGRANTIVANAEAVKKYLVTNGVNEKKIVVIHNGIDVERLTPKETFSREETLSSFGLPAENEKRFVTIVANLRHPVKDIPTFLRSAKRVHSAFPNSCFVIAGEGELTDELKTLACEIGIEKVTFFLGRCARVAELLSVSDVCVLSSANEGFSNSIIEYMVASCPVVATDAGGASEAISDGETGFVVAVGDDEAMAMHIIFLLQDGIKARVFGAKGRERVITEFSCAAQLEKTEKLYERLLHSR